MKKCVNCGQCFVSDSWNCPSCGNVPSNINGIAVLAQDVSGAHEAAGRLSPDLVAKLQETNFWFAARNRIIKMALERFFPKAESLLEVGCGTGFALAALEKNFPSIRLCGGDVYLQGLEIAAGKVSSQTELILMDTMQMPFSREFDIVCVFDTLEHIKDDEGALAQMFEALKPGGGFMITVPQHPWLWSRFDEMSLHERRYGARELKAKLARAGFSVRYTTSFVTLLFPALLFSRLRFALSKTRKTQNELQSGFVNAAMGKVMSLETALIAHGARLPFGGSLISVAQKPRQ